uniref:Secreted protein n=1 Tax=Ascaris lumbricoides TaxID=6252 RepID=A0A0M3I9D7_ASCLU
MKISCYSVASLYKSAFSRVLLEYLRPHLDKIFILISRSLLPQCSCFVSSLHSLVAIFFVRILRARSLSIIAVLMPLRLLPQQPTSLNVVAVYGRCETVIWRLFTSRDQPNRQITQCNAYNVKWRKTDVTDLDAYKQSRCAFFPQYSAIGVSQRGRSPQR